MLNYFRLGRNTKANSCGVNRWEIGLVTALSLCFLSPVMGAASAPWVGQDLKGIPCKGSPPGYGPYDYRTATKRQIKIVEDYHFSPKIEMLQPDELLKAGSSVPGNINYTLRAFPNHHRALYSMIRYALRGPDHEAEFKARPECYLQRAANFAPDDGMVPLLFGIYLHRLGKSELARSRYEEALTLAPNSAEAHYNLGLLLVADGDYESARLHAQAAYNRGHPLPGLRKKLIEAGFPP